MPANSENPEINTRVYDFCVRAFRTTRKLLKLNIKMHQEGNGEDDPVHQGDIFLFNHFARFETFIPQVLINEATGAYCRSVADAVGNVRCDAAWRFPAGAVCRYPRCAEF